ncbi:hypothetical protein BH10ACT8_BH10ACT8_11030 [soil metagenome]|jgi:signal transduction histidine kinase
MSVTGLSPAKTGLALAWLVFASVNAALMYLLPGEETIPYHLIWASFALLYGLYRWSTATTWLSFTGITAVTGLALVKHASSGIIGWEECSEIVLMGVLVALLIWHVNRQALAQDRLAELREIERTRAEHREVTARFGSHEVRTRLTIARGFTELIRDNAIDETTRADATLVLDELDKASTIATKVLTLVRVESPSQRLPVDLTQLVSTILLRWSAAAERQWSSDIRVGMMLGDAERLEAALDCLIENAVKFTSVGDSISIYARADGQEVVMAVADTGSGIPPSDLDRVTAVFETGSEAGDRAGSGLGLAIVKAIVEARGGTLQVDSVLSLGTTVSFRIPGVHAASPLPPTAERNLAESASVAIVPVS